MANQKKAEALQRFFKTGKGEYGAGDKFLGVVVPKQRLLVKKYWHKISIAETQKLLQSKFHEERLIALLILVAKFQALNPPSRKATAGKKEIYDLYLESARRGRINNWDLVDLSAPNIVGAYLAGKDWKILRKLSLSKNLWERRISALATFQFIKDGNPKPALAIAEILLNDTHNLIHKAAGWMLREVGRPRASLANRAGKRCGRDVEEKFLQKHASKMPRVMLRYAIERFAPDKKKYYYKLVWKRKKAK